MTTGAFSFIFDSKNRILLCRRYDKDIWNLPGGKVEKGEAPWAAAIREAKEEIGVTIKIEKLAGIFFKPIKDDLVFQFVSKITEGIPTKSEEAKEVAYFDIDDLPQNISPLQSKRIKLFFDNPEEFQLLNQ